MKRIIDKQEHLYIMPSSLQPKIVWRREGGQKIRMRNAQHQPRLLEVVNSNRLEIHKVGGGHHGHGGGLRISCIGNHTVVNPTTDYYLPTFVSSLVKSSPAKHYQKQQQTFIFVVVHIIC